MHPRSTLLRSSGIECLSRSATMNLLTCVRSGDGAQVLLETVMRYDDKLRARFLELPRRDSAVDEVHEKA